jgi:enoyl-CoA hydratase
MTYALNDALMKAAADRAARVIILCGEGRHFSTGHDLRELGFGEVGSKYPLTSTWSDMDLDTIEGWFGIEREVFLDMCRRWRGIAKPTIAQVQGACVGGGLMLAWVCDLIVAADTAFFQDPVVNLGVGGVEFFAHAWEIGARRAKEKLFTADRWTAAEAEAWGMVNHVVPEAELASFTLELARRIALKPSFALKLAKEAVNGSLDAQGFTSATDRAFYLHQLAHAQNRLKFGGIIDPAGIPATVRKSGDIPTIVIGRGK